jgi:hypothetical protein
MMQHIGGQFRHLALPRTYEPADAGLHAKPKIIEPLAEPVQHCRCASLSAIHGYSVELLPCMQELESCCALQTVRLCIDPFGDAMLRFSD